MKDKDDIENVEPASNEQKHSMPQSEDRDKKTKESSDHLAAILPGAVAESSSSNHCAHKDKLLSLTPPTTIAPPITQGPVVAATTTTTRSFPVQDAKKQSTKAGESHACTPPSTKMTPTAVVLVEVPSLSLNSEDVASKVKHQLEEQIESQWQERLQQEVQAQLQSRQQLRQQKDLPMVVQAISVTKEEDVVGSPPTSRLGYRWIFALVVLVILFGGGVVAVLFVVLSANDQGSSEDTNKPVISTAPTAVPTSTSTAIPTESPHQTYLLEWMGPYIAPTNSAEEWSWFDDPTSSQAQAMEWMVNHDDYASKDNLPTANIQTLLERYALAVLYYSTSGDEWWLDFDFLNGNTSTCLWNNGGAIGRSTTRGVLCDDENDATGFFVTHMYLPHTHLMGTIPWEISLLQELVVMDMEYNTLTGSLPHTLAALSLLTTLKLQENSLTGSLPASLPNLIEVLRLTNNFLTGTLVGDWSNTMPHLIHMQLGLNQFQGSIPSEWDDRFEQLQQIDMEANAIIGTIPSTLGLITTLRYLFFESNQLSGTLPTELGNLSDLNMFYIFGNTGLTGTVPEAYGNWTHLDLFLLDNTTLTGSIDSIFCSGAFGDDIPSLMADCLLDSYQEMECSCCALCCSPDAEVCVEMNSR